MTFKMAKERSTERRKDDDRRGSVVDRRLGLDRRRGPGRRLSEDRKSAEEGQMSDEQFDFIMAIDEYKRKNTRPFPTWTEVLDVIKALGYRKVAEPQSLEQDKKEQKSKETKVPLRTLLD
jgi:protein-tyrosine-phosphatase